MKPILTFIILVSFSINNFIFSQLLPQENSILFKQTNSVFNKVIEKNNFTNTIPLDSSASLPIGIHKQIGQSTYIIAIDSAKFLPNAASCNAYMLIGLPGIADSLAFAAKNIGINPKGVLSGNSGNSKLQLVSNHIIHISPKIKLILKNDGNNYVEWNCNGFQAINIKGYFEFSETILEPETKSSTDSTVKASFEIHTNDIHNLIMTVNISPFKIKGINDLSFTVNEAVADFSEVANAPLMNFPVGYNLNDPNPLMWNGFFIKNVTIKLPKEISNKNQNSTTISANNLIIDNTGLSGKFSAQNILSSQNSEMESWKFSVNQLEVGILQNHINSGSIAGNIQLPIFDNNSLNYSAAISENPTNQELDYNFTISTQNNIEASVLSAKIDIYNTSQIQISKTANKFVPMALLNGKIKFNNSNLNTSKLDFQNLKIESNVPYITQGIFSYTGNSVNKSMNFPICINQISLILNDNKPTINLNVGLNFMESSDQGFAANVGITVKTKLTQTAQNNTYPTLAFDKIKVNDIDLDISTQAFFLKGKLIHLENHTLYGNAIAGSMTITLAQINNMSASFNALFGALPNYKYFYVDGSVIFPQAIPLTGNLKLKGLMGGLYYHMNKNVDYVAAMQTTTNGPIGVYYPDNSKSIGFKAGCTIFYSVEETFNADMVLEMNFNSQQNGGGIANINFSGDVFSMISIANRQGKRYNQVPLGANGFINYDFNAKILHATLNAGINLSSYVYGNVSCAAHFEENLWYVNIGKPSNKGNLTVTYLGYVKAYFMTGKQIETPVLPPVIAQHFGNPNNRNSTQLNNGNAFCMGAEINKSVSAEFPFSFFTVYGSINYTSGFDLMMTKVQPNYICQNTGDSPGFKGNYLDGNLYSYLNGSIGVKGIITIANEEKKFDFQILNVNAHALLYGQLIKPTYIEGNITASYNILNAVNGNLNFNFKTGTKCNG